MAIEPVILEGRFVRLEPLSPIHLPGLCEVGLDPDLWRWTTAPIRTPEEMGEYVREALRLQEQGTALPFAVLDRASGRVAGSTRFGNISAADRRVEIGWTWIAPAWQRTRVNTEGKLLLLRHAFETWRCIRVEFKTDALNERSRRALLRIGAREEGTLRQHMIVHGGRLRDSVYYSVLDREWAGVQAELLRKLAD